MTAWSQPEILQKTAWSQLEIPRSRYKTLTRLNSSEFLSYSEALTSLNAKAFSGHTLPPTATRTYCRDVQQSLANARKKRPEGADPRMSEVRALHGNGFSPGS